jgi:hypothetical protein
LLGLYSANVSKYATFTLTAKVDYNVINLNVIRLITWDINVTEIMCTGLEAGVKFEAFDACQGIFFKE